MVSMAVTLAYVPEMHIGLVMLLARLRCVRYLGHYGIYAAGNGGYRLHAGLENSTNSLCAGELCWQVMLFLVSV